MQHSHLGCYGIICNNSCIALIKKARGPYTGLLDLPGGTPDFGEAPDQTVTREIREELGLEVTESKLIYVDSFVKNYIQNGESCQLHHTGIIYKCSVASFDLNESGDGLDSNGGVWVPIQKVVQNTLTPFVISAIEYLREFNYCV